MTAIQTTVVGNLVDDPELRFTSNGTPVASFKVAANENYKDASGKWQDGPASFLPCNAWRELADHVAESLRKGNRVIATGILRQRNYETKEGEKRTTWELSATSVGPDLRYATAKITKVHRDQAPVPEDPWSDQAPTPNAPADEGEPPF